MVLVVDRRNGNRCFVWILAYRVGVCVCCARLRGAVRAWMQEVVVQSFGAVGGGVQVQCPTVKPLTRSPPGS